VRPPERLQGGAMLAEVLQEATTDPPSFLREDGVQVHAFVIKVLQHRVDIGLH